jgi:23S rRNA (adenosine1067-2'-O)-methyltransferase
MNAHPSLATHTQENLGIIDSLLHPLALPIRASRGYIFSLPIMTATTAGLINFCRRNGLPMLVMAARAENFLDKVASLSKRLVIIFGSEKDGCSQALKDAATLQVRIPTNPGVESLNVSIAAGIMLYNRNWFNNSLIRK